MLQQDDNNFVSDILQLWQKRVFWLDDGLAFSENNVDEHLIYFGLEKMPPVKHPLKDWYDWKY